MTHNRIMRRGLFGLLLAGSATMALAQETVTPPTITSPSAPAAAEAPAPAPTASPSISFAPNAPVVQQAPPPAPPPESVRNPAPEPGAATVARSPQRRSVAPARRVAQPAAAEPATLPPAPVAEAPVAAPRPEVTRPPAAPSVAPEAVAPAPATDEVSSGAAWAILGITLAVLAGWLAWLITRRRRRTTEAFDYDEPAIEQEAEYHPTYQVMQEPVAASPVAAPVIASATAGEHDARPWIDIGLRPISAEDALEVEVTVSNSGDAPAHDVRVSTWMLHGQSSEGEQALIDSRADARTTTLSVPPGADESVSSVLDMPQAGTPILVAEARYPLPQGGEGRIAATFEIETSGDPTNVEARLHEVIERA